MEGKEMKFELKNMLYNVLFVLCNITFAEYQFCIITR